MAFEKTAWSVCLTFLIGAWQFVSFAFVPDAQALSCSGLKTKLYIHCMDGKCPSSFGVFPLRAGEMCATRPVVRDLGPEEISHVRAVLVIQGIEQFTGLIEIDVEHFDYEVCARSHDAGACQRAMTISSRVGGITSDVFQSRRDHWEHVERMERISFLAKTWGKAFLLLGVVLVLVLALPPKDTSLRFTRTLLVAGSGLYALSWSTYALVSGGGRPWHLLVVGSLVLLLGAPVIRRLFAVIKIKFQRAEPGPE